MDGWVWEKRAKILVPAKHIGEIFDGVKQSAPWYVSALAAKDDGDGIKYCVRIDDDMGRHRDIDTMLALWKIFRSITNRWLEFRCDLFHVKPVPEYRQVYYHDMTALSSEADVEVWFAYRNSVGAENPYDAYLAWLFTQTRTIIDCITPDIAVVIMPDWSMPAMPDGYRREEIMTAYGGPRENLDSSLCSVLYLYSRLISLLIQNPGMCVPFVVEREAYSLQLGPIVARNCIERPGPLQVHFLGKVTIVGWGPSSYRPERVAPRIEPCDILIRKDGPVSNVFITKSLVSSVVRAAFDEIQTYTAKGVYTELRFVDTAESVEDDPKLVTSLINDANGRLQAIIMKRGKMYWPTVLTVPEE